MKLSIPDEVRQYELMPVVSVSGGKDSTAAALALRESGFENVRYVFADTGWEAKETYEHLELLEKKLGTIHRVQAARQMVESIRHRAGFPARKQRWCTRELKLIPLRSFFDDLELKENRETVCVVGIRARESKRRAQMQVFEDDETWGGFMWRPILDWTIEDVLAIHHRHGVPVNPLYRRGHNRVGCYPCIYATKEDVRLIAEHSPERIDQIRELEDWCEDERKRRNAEKPGRYAHPNDASFFQSRKKNVGKCSGIDEVVAWSRTAGDAKTHLTTIVPLPPVGGCFRWGLCEPPVTDEEE